ncbi:enoyl-ACP reductase FabI [Persicirhabdus sediminis]|uniref:Enoyl-[acyl-carrier-protein] reductase [NADH] n=1 Tax=Persicirhabdus sediminis TaxID=454144 RepID=A0A8J7MBR0_9BACT|nr:enoyl-ACP reductase [Persicirhabdus sediminis]MBK1789658.1 enoyl-ACP reductase [Persicirhabdus sediminis]
MSYQPLSGKTAVVFGVANKRSIAYAVAKAWHDAGANLILNYQGERNKDSVAKIAQSLSEDIPVYPCDVSSDVELDEFFENVKKHSDTIDIVLHAVAFAPREALENPFIETSREAYSIAHDISAYSLVAIAQRAETMMPSGGSILAMSYYGAAKVIPRYNVMGVAKASLEASTRYLAADLGAKNIRVNCVSAGPVNTLAARGIGGLNLMLKHYEKFAPLGRTCTLEEIGATSLFLATDGAGGITGQTIYVDGGYEINGMTLEEEVYPNK